jgi:hypothetical protein
MARTCSLFVHPRCVCGMIYLGEPLFEVVEEHVRLVRENSKGSIVTHTEGGLLACHALVSTYKSTRRSIFA